MGIITHGSTRGHKKSLAYVSWTSMKQRCNNPKYDRYYGYGGRGIKICKRWDSFEKFLEDMGPRPSLEYSLDRINNEGNYTPKNCRWATSQQQVENKRNRSFLEYKGKRVLLTDWAKKVGLNRRTLSGRIEAGWSIEDALNKPVGKWIKSNGS